jgi:HAE1 family hydrophobic/amphiphilic exporter-1
MLKMMGLANDVYAQIGMIMLIGLLGKNAVLIVEFGVQRHNEGVPILNAAIEGAKMRFRPILMTSFAFIAGLIPLVIAHGAGAVGNKTIGSSAMGGMLIGTLIGVLIIPGLYYTFGKLVEGKNLLRNESHSSLSEAFVENGEAKASLIKKISKLSVLLKVAQRKNNKNEK